MLNSTTTTSSANTSNETSFEGCNNESGTRPNSYDYFIGLVHLGSGIVTIVANLVFLRGLHKCHLLTCGCFITLAHFAVCDIMNGVLNVSYVPWVLMLQYDFVPRYIPGAVNILAEWSRKTFLTFMCFSRFLAIVFPFTFKSYMGNSVIHLWLQGVWILCILLCFPFWLLHAIEYSFECVGWIYAPDVPRWIPLYGLATNLIPTVLMLVLYPICFSKLVFLGHKVHKPGNSEDSTLAVCETLRTLETKEKSMLFLFACCSLVFTVYWVPYYLPLIFGIEIPGKTTAFEIMRDVQSVYNPFLYYWCHPTLKEAIRAGIGLKK